MIIAAAFVLTAVAVPIGWWRVLVAEGLLLAVVAGLSGVPPRALIRRWLGFLVLVAFSRSWLPRASDAPATVSAWSC